MRTVDDDRVVDHAAALAFAASWVDAWNSHDLDRILEHFADDAVFSSPIAAALLPESGGVLVGKSAIRGYWEIGLARIPDLRFEIVAVYRGVDTVVINYRNHVGGLVCEVLRFAGASAATGDDGASAATGDDGASAATGDDGASGGRLVVRGDGTYVTDDAAGASGVR